MVQGLKTVEFKIFGMGDQNVKVEAFQKKIQMSKTGPI